MAESSRAKEVSLVAMLAVLAVALNLVIAIPAPFAGFLYYEVWEVPVVLGFLALGFWGGASVAVLNSLVLEAVNPGSLPTGPLYNLMAELSMFVGIMAVLPFVRRRGGKTSVVAATASGAVVRTAAMTVVNAIVLTQPYPIGFGSFGVTWAQVPLYLVQIGVFNATVTLYTVPLAFAAKKVIESRYRPFWKSGSQGLPG